MPPTKKLIKIAKLNLPFNFLSPSQIDMYYFCPKQYHLRYILHLKVPPTIYMIESASHHLVLKNNNEYKIKTGKDRSIKYLVQKFCDIFDDEVKDVSKDTWRQSGLTRDKVIYRGKFIQVQYNRLIAPYFEPIICEKAVQLDINGINVIGVIDVVGTYKTIFGVFDYKIMSKPKSGGELIDSVALSHYGLYVKKSISSEHKLHVGYITLKKVPDFKSIVRYVPLTTQRITRYRQQVMNVARAISCGMFPKKKNCNPRYCDHGLICAKAK